MRNVWKRKKNKDIRKVAESTSIEQKRGEGKEEGLREGNYARLCMILMYVIR